MGKNAFAGLRVIDMTRYLPGGYATQVFADLGAEVIKVEEQKKGDFCRGDEPKINDVSYYFTALCRNKKSLTLNLKAEKGHDIFLQLAQEADIIIENYRPGVTKRLGIDYDAINKINPRIIYCSLSGFGQESPLSLAALHDINLQAMSGYLSVNGGKLTPFHLCDVASAMTAAQGIALALYAREKTGRGQSVDIPMFDSLLWWLSLITSRYHFQNNQVSAETLEYPALCYNVLKTKDGGYLSLGMVEDKFWRQFCIETGNEDLIPKQMLRRHEAPGEFERIEQLIAGKTLMEWREWLKGKDICIVPVVNVGEAVEAIVAQNSGIMQYVDYPGVGKVLQTDIPYKFSELSHDLQSATPPPVLGEHTREILARLGYKQEEIAALVKDGVVTVAS
ncbi:MULTISPECIES: CaiB/BaiF CoA-transferase family protein [unclassified Brenneria]|uniref:CaiB/BaiF CoA transferase family protein n=1 Tax=unclassified Brenneria TaxID=2634434 RepID=UPI0029C4D050|nr:MULTISPECIES: CaiB/BaiF CoA-transferase family protein [unclassified Brenneria]MDX5628777.1 CaiB/BaiF CoA-transferase family protein [Brenneria sp. L3-3Z]MDX5695916.1 CaiB/BaiF CoA-transferase family protein [Brenneria sp. L4-2C]MEE3661206.1 CaiB/BaiF CoA-transferase family protein [Brenneria sp. g21c3]